MKVPRDWRNLIAYLERPGNLARMQAICGSLGRYAEQVFFGGLTMQRIGEVIGTGLPVVHEAMRAGPVRRDYCGWPVGEWVNKFKKVIDGDSVKS